MSPIFESANPTDHWVGMEHPICNLLPADLFAFSNSIVLFHDDLAITNSFGVLGGRVELILPVSTANPITLEYDEELPMTGEEFLLEPANSFHSNVCGRNL